MALSLPLGIKIGHLLLHFRPTTGHILPGMRLAGRRSPPAPPHGARRWVASRWRTIKVGCVTRLPSLWRHRVAVGFEEIGALESCASVPLWLNWTLPRRSCSITYHSRLKTSCDLPPSTMPPCPRSDMSESGVTTWQWVTVCQVEVINSRSNLMQKPCPRVPAFMLRLPRRPAKPWQNSMQPR